MEYVASSSEDRKLHDKYHKQNVDGYDVGKDFVVKVRQEGKRLCVFKGVKEGDAILYVDCRNSVHRKRKAQGVLEIVQRELGAVGIPEEEIWEGRTKSSGQALEDPTYRSFLYVRGAKCVGFLLVKRIEQAFEVVRPKALEKHLRSATAARGKAEAVPRTQSALEKLRARKQQEADAAQAVKDEIEQAAGQLIELSETRHSAIMGISRIWTSSSVRGQGIARCLLNTAINRHNSAIGSREDGKQPTTSNTPRKIGRRQDIAFSQPTTSGAQLARKWFGRAYGWRVYVD